MKITDETIQFIRENSEVDVRKLALKSAHYPEIDMSFALQQIAGRQIVKNKIPTFFINENIIFPPKISLEQCSSEATARYKAALCIGKTFIDLTGGFGCDCYFISRNFEQAFFVEKNTELCHTALHNFAALHADNIHVKCLHAENYILEIKEKVDVIYLDPARRSNMGKKTVLITECTPNVAEMVDEYRRRRNFLASAFAGMGMECHRPLGAFYAFPSIARFGIPSKEFALRLLKEERVAVVPGTAFGECGEGFVRCAYATSMRNIEEAMIRMKRFINRL